MIDEHTPHHPVDPGAPKEEAVQERVLAADAPGERLDRAVAPKGSRLLQ